MSDLSAKKSSQIYIFAREVIMYNNNDNNYYNHNNMNNNNNNVIAFPGLFVN